MRKKDPSAHYLIPHLAQTPAQNKAILRRIDWLILPLFLVTRECDCRPLFPASCSLAISLYYTETIQYLDK